MIRRERLETSINHERWLVSYADFITLLFAFFVVMYSVSHVSEEKYKELSNTLQQTFNAKPLSNSASASETQSEVESEAENKENVRQANFEDLSQKLEETFSALLESGDIDLSGNEDWVEIKLNSNLLFESASAEPSTQARDIFAEAAALLAPYDNLIEVSGHTDNVPINNSAYSDNWSLSAARSVAIVALLSNQNIDPKRLSAVAYGEHQPIGSNDTEEGRAQNRRVVLRVSRDLLVAREEDLDEFYSSELGGDNAQALNQSQTGLEQGGETPIAEKEQAGNSETNNTVDEAADELETVDPVKLKDGGLLFTSDPDLPRINR